MSGNINLSDFTCLMKYSTLMAALFYASLTRFTTRCDYATGNTPARACYYHIAHSTIMSELSGPIIMSATFSKKMCLMKDNESMVFLEYIELILELFCLEL